MEVYVPDIYQENIYKIDYEILKSRGIKCLFFDLFFTLFIPEPLHLPWLVKPAVTLYSLRLLLL